MAEQEQAICPECKQPAEKITNNETQLGLWWHKDISDPKKCNRTNWGSYDEILAIMR